MTGIWNSCSSTVRGLSPRGVSWHTRSGPVWRGSDWLSWPYSSAPSSASSTLRCRGFLSRCWRVVYAATVIGFFALGALAEYRVHQGLTYPGLMPLERLSPLIWAAGVFPFDRNLRRAPVQFLMNFERDRPHE